MGSQCSTNNIKQEYQIIREFKHVSLGQIKLIRSVRTYNNSNAYGNRNRNNSNQHKNVGLFNQEGNNGKFVVVGEDDGNSGVRDGQIIAIKQLRFATLGERDKYVKIVKQAGCYSKIPTLLRIYSYEINGNKAISNPLHLNNYRCSHSYPINIYFAYYPFTLQQQMTLKRTHLLQQMQTTTKVHSVLKNIKLNNYAEIDRLPSAERKIINLYYQQVEILRFIDYVVGALYFLDHLEHPHQALCPQNVMIDDQGKYALLDASVFKLKTNYQVAYTQLYKQELHEDDTDAKRSGLKYLSPELLSHIKNKHVQHRQSSQKSEVFSIGLIALEMCLIDFNVLEENSNQATQDFSILDKTSLRINKNSLNKALIMAQSRYSLELVDLLALMLQNDPQKRITFSTLIDMLSPLLVKNLAEIQKLYNPQNRNSGQFMNLQSPRLQQSSLSDSRNPLFHKLAQLQTNFNKIMARTSILQSSITEQSQRSTFDQQFILNDEKRILKQLKRINFISNGKNKQSMLKNGTESKNEPRRQVKGSQLYDLYLSQYETIKRNRLR